jgi:Na+-translocating ferredoxin:NAD+ oxidoreductase RnfD subunit
MTRRSDPRPHQIAVLSCLLLWGLLALDFEVTLAQAAFGLLGALLTQLWCSESLGQRFDPRSALISGLSLALLLRVDSPSLAALAGFLAVASKFAIRVKGRHVFNPSCFAIVVLLATTDHAWVSAGQWGSAAFFALAAAGLGSFVVHRAARADVSFAFLGFTAALHIGRALWLGDPLDIPLHALRSGALLVFAFHMISDPKTLPARRAGRVIFAALVALGAFGVQYGLYRTNGLLWSLFCAAPLVPLIDRLLPGAAPAWSPTPASGGIQARKEQAMHRPHRRLAVTAGLVLAALVGVGSEARAFCGFYVARADTQLFNKASQVVLVRDGDRTVITMSNDFRGDPKEFAMVIPVPTFVTREQIHVGERAVIEHLDAYTSPRLVEYFDPDPCARPVPRVALEDFSAAKRAAPEAVGRARADGVTIEASYTVGEYDILILSAEQSDGLARWLRSSGYRLPDGAEPVLDSYLRQDMHFFVAKVNLEEQSKLGFSYLRPLQVAYESAKFVLPIRLGTLNADGTQDLFIYTLTRRGRVETTNYRSVKLPTGMDVPVYVKQEFGDFYTALFSEQVQREHMRAVFTEYAWDMAWCDPCAADPLSAEELRELGVFWVDGSRGGPARNAFVTRLHVRYDAEHFPADLVLQETADRTNFQGRYVLRHAFEGATCPAADEYYRQVRERQEREARTLASLTGWSLADIRERIGLLRDGTIPAGGRPWWERIWSN